ncbi:MAG: hypothetical protein MUE50_14780, partial [Pirellulaceae bacterium]|nr:hypothetical protein [Pirellulaceae bacterium]
PNPTWGGYPLACDWFDVARRQAVDLIGIEDWMGLQYMLRRLELFGRNCLAFVVRQVGGVGEGEQRRGIAKAEEKTGGRRGWAARV